MSDQMTSAEQLEYIRRIVKWTLWKVATTDPESDIPWRGYSVGESACIQGHAEELFKDTGWVAAVTGEFAAHSANRAAENVDFAAFVELLKD